MNNYVPDWNYETDLPVTGQKNPTGADHDLVELLWRNGQVVLNSQTQRKQAINISNEPPTQALQHNKLHDHDHHHNGPMNMAQDDHDTVSWIHHYPIEDSFDNKEFCSNFFSELLSCDPIAAKQSEDEEEAAVGRECSLSHCGSNQLNAAGPAQPAPIWAGPSGKAEAHEPTATSSSGGSGSSFGRAFKQCPTTTTSGNTANNKRKNREPEELECQSKAAELEYAAVNGSAPRAGSSRKSRAAEVHNLSERRRRDRINEKMKALQELIPHSNKTDKASMLDEAIEYLKSLQLQLQVMWMGSGMAPVMLPGSQHYMSRIGMAVGPPAGMLGPIQSLPRAPESMIAAPSTDHQIMCQTQAAFNLLNYTNHPMQSASLHEQYARLMGFHPIQTVTQPMNVFRFNPRTVQQQQGQSIAQQGINNGPSSGWSSD